MEVLDRKLTRNERKYVRQQLGNIFDILTIVYWVICLAIYVGFLYLSDPFIDFEPQGFLMFSFSFLVLCIIVKVFILPGINFKQKNDSGYLYRITGKVKTDSAGTYKVGNKGIIFPVAYITNKLIKAGDEITVEAFHEYPPGMEPEDFFIALKINNRYSVHDDYYAVRSKGGTISVFIMAILGLMFVPTAIIMSFIFISDWQIDKKTQVLEHWNVFFTNSGTDIKGYKNMQDFKTDPPSKWQAFRLDSVYLFPTEYEGNLFLIFDDKKQLDSMLFLVSGHLEMDLLTIVPQKELKASGQSLKEYYETLKAYDKPELVHQIIDTFNKIYTPPQRYLIRKDYMPNHYYDNAVTFLKNTRSATSVSGYNIGIDFGKDTVFNQIQLIDDEFDEFIWLMGVYFVALICIQFYLRRFLKMRMNDYQIKRRYGV